MPAADERDRKSPIREYWEALLIAIIFVNFARIFVFQAFKIPTPSMEDNLKVGDHIIVNKFIYGPAGDGPFSSLMPLRDIHRGDIIVFRFPKDPEVDYVKRVIGLPGDTIRVSDKRVFVNGRKLDEPYTIHVDPQVYPEGPFLPEPYRSRDHYPSFRIPPGEYFAMGDNRDRSSDSRFWGTVPRSHIKGRAFMVYWSFGLPPERGTAGRDRARELSNVVRYFFTETRWHRTFFIVDSKYHYTPGVMADGNE
jgi:signal peptidase I